MENYFLLDHSDGINPFLLCDGHISWFDEPFLEYTLDSNIPWTFCIGVTYGTSVWKLGYSPQQNVTFNIDSKKAKADAVRLKIRASLPARASELLTSPGINHFPAWITILKPLLNMGAPS
jgi:hypothetical protein